jgi:hypothetical protein
MTGNAGTSEPLRTTVSQHLAETFCHEDQSYAPQRTSTVRCCSIVSTSSNANRGGSSHAVLSIAYEIVAIEDFPVNRGAESQAVRLDIYQDWFCSSERSLQGSPRRGPSTYAAESKLGCSREWVGSNRSRTHNPHNRHRTTRNTQHHAPRGGATPSKLFPPLSDLISRSLSFVRVFHSPAYFVVLCFVADLPNSAWKSFG